MHCLAPYSRQAITRTNNDIVNWPHTNTFRWNFNKHMHFFIHKNAFENVVCVTAANMLRPPCINSLRPSDAYVRQKLTIIVSDNGLSPGRRQAIIWTNAVILSIGPLGTNFSKILNEIYIFSFKKSIWECRQEIGGHFVSASVHYQVPAPSCGDV